jgi:predicted flap endonuclease-1-like 5' DNA nuclease
MSSPFILAALAVALIAGFLLGRRPRNGRDRTGPGGGAPAPPAIPDPSASPAVAGAAFDPGGAGAAAATPAPTATSPEAARDGVEAERARLMRSFEAETAALRRTLTARDATLQQLAELDADRRRTYDDLARARAETARYRQLVVDLENNALPPLLDGPGAPDDLKLIVGVGPVLERMLHQLGVMTYRQIARWTERDIDEFDARLPEFPGRIRRDAWVTQARALHQSKFGEILPARERH